MLNSISSVQQTITLSEYGLSDAKEKAHRQAGREFWRAYSRGIRSKIWSALTGRRNHLLALAEVQKNITVQARSYAGVRSVPIHQIQGSEGRSDDFNANFGPLQTHTQTRWEGIAAARRMGITLPPVDLIQVGDVYFVRDGHHRISVAKTLGQESIDATVTVWDVAGPLPWECPTPAGEMALQPV